MLSTHITYYCVYSSYTYILIGEWSEESPPSCLNFSMNTCNVCVCVCNVQELLGIAYNRLILIDLHTMEHKKTWRYSAMRSWNVNWESKQLRIDHEEDKLVFQCLSADLKILHEFIGGNIWLSLRNDKDQLDVAMFVKLTGGVTNNLQGWGAETMTRFLQS